MLRRILCTLTLLAALCAVLGVSVSAETVRAVAYAQSGYTGSDNAVFRPTSPIGIRVLDMTGNWDFTGDAGYVKRQLRDGFCTAFAILETEECEGDTTFILDVESDLSYYNFLCFGVSFNRTGVPGAQIKLELELTDSGGNRAVAQTWLGESSAGLSGASEDDSWSMVYFDLSGFEGRENAASFTVRFSYHPAAAPAAIRVTNPYVSRDDRGGLAHVGRYLSNSVTASAGAFGMSAGMARPDERGQVRLSAPLVLAELPKTGSEAFLLIELSHFTSGGLSVGIEYENGEVFYVSRIGISSDGESSEVYAVPIEISGRLRSYELTFDSMVCDGYFMLSSVGLQYTDTVEPEGHPELGKVSSVRRDGSGIVFSGVMDREAVRKYDDNAVIRFYAVPGLTAGDPDTAVEIGQTKVSTRFDHTADLSAHPALADTYRFFAAVTAEDGTFLPISPPVYPDADDLPQKTLSNIGLYNAATVGVFESNASHVIVDIPIDRLLFVSETDKTSVTSFSYTVYETAGGENGNTITGRTEKVPVSLELLRTLDSEINFYISAGIEVYLRLTTESVIDGLTYPGEGTAHCSFAPQTAEARRFYTSLVRFLCRRYSGAGGLVIGNAVNDENHTGCPAGMTEAAYAEELAELCRITYNAASAEIPDVMIVLPFGEEPAGGHASRVIPTGVLNVMLAAYLENTGSIPWVMMYCADNLRGILGTDILYGDAFGKDQNLSDSRSVVQRARHLTGELGLKSCAAVMYFYEPSFESTMFGFYNTSKYPVYNRYLAALVTTLCGSTRARAVFFSLEELNDHLEYEFYSCLKSADTTGKNLRSVSDFTAQPLTSMRDEMEGTVSRTTLWDFTESFHPLGWIAGGGVSSCLTVYSDLFTEAGFGGDRYARVLRSVIAVDEDSRSPERSGVAAGISLRNLSRTVDMSEADYLEFTFAMSHPGMIMGTGHESGKVVFVLGSDDFRAEFEVSNAAADQVQTYVCDLTDYEYRDRIDYMGIMVYADHEVYLDLSSVTVCSRTLPQDALDALFAPEPAERAPETDHAAIVLVSGIVFVLSVSAAVLFIRYDVEESRERRKRLLEEEKRRRRERTRRI